MVRPPVDHSPGSVFATSSPVTSPVVGEDSGAPVDDLTEPPALPWEEWVGGFSVLLFFFTPHAPIAYQLVTDTLGSYPRFTGLQ